MRGGVQLLRVAALLALVPAVWPRCDRFPDANLNSKTMSDGRFRIYISGNPETYVPGEQYTVFLRGTVNAIEQHKFKDFLLVVEQEAADPMREPYHKPSLGAFTLYADTLTKFSERCPNAVTQTNSLPKTEIQVLWQAPQSGSGCVAFRATVVQQKDLWFMDDDDLTKILCEEVTESDDTQPLVLNRCCACDEAKYEVTFEGLWSRNTHPRDFPSNGWLTRFSDVIGASHTKNYTFWNYGEFASEGLRQVAENGNTRVLESELKAKSDHIRTIIKARGISYPNVTGRTFAVFRVDNHHHLMSLVSMIDPSPDWFVGVSSLELCLRNCSWIESKVLNLYPWDAGTDDGMTYIAADLPSTPHIPIRRIKSNSPNDPRSPFYDPTGAEMKPLARLHLIRQRLYEKTCDYSPVDSDDGSSVRADDDCEVTDWSDWSPCSATCGKGIKYRQRAYVKESSKFRCTKHLTSRGSCWGLQRHCPDKSEEKLSDPMCALSDWSEWSSCSVTCGIGSRTRSRRYLTRNATKHCNVGVRNRALLAQTEGCIGIHGACDNEPLADGAEFNIKDCPHRPWSEWSPCSVTCGRGYQIRERLPVQEKFDEDENFTHEEDEEEEEDPCEDEKVKEVVACTAEIPSCDMYPPNVESICTMPRDVGRCRSNINRWFFDIIRASCEPFVYTGCHGNHNNFESKEQCERVCGNFQKELIYNRTTQKKQLGVSVSSVLSYDLQLQDDANTNTNCVTTEVLGGLQPGSFIVNTPPPDQHEVTDIVEGPTGPVVHCEVSRWSKWSPCNATACNKGYKIKYRHITKHRMNGGQTCPKKLMRIKKCRVACDREKDRENNLDPIWGPTSPIGSAIDCVMSKWSPWSPCSHSCGSYSVRQRTRTILVHPSGGGKPCLNRIETKPCNKLACPID